MFAVGCTKNNISTETNTVQITSRGFYPRTITIYAGDAVTWINNDSEPHWVASAVHPVHDDYPDARYDEPGSYQGSRACIAEGRPKTGAFDACRTISLGETYKFNFTQIGTWQYHDHMNYAFIGSVVVKKR